MRWISGYLDCLIANGNSSLSIKQPRIALQIDRAIENLYQEGDDPTNGGFNRRNANQEGLPIILSITEPVDSVNRVTAHQYYSDGSIDIVSECHGFHSGAPGDFQFIDVLRTCYFPGNATLITPVLGIDINASNEPVAFRWIAIAYQVESGIPFSRYNYDICVDGNKCR